MPGFLVSSGGGSTLDGQASTVMYNNIGTASAVIFTASTKTRIESMIAVNRTPGILPIDVYIEKNSEFFNIIKSARVKKSKQLINPNGVKEPDLLIKLAPGSQETTIADDLPPEIILNPGESLCAVSLVDNSFDIIASIKENIQ